MPKRSNEFQDLITLVERALAPIGAQVCPSEELVDRLTGAKREVDIVIRHTVGNHRVTISVECTAEARPASVQWVDRLAGTHQSLPTDKLILVSAAGFSKEATAKSQALGIDTYTLADATTLDWASVVHGVPEIRLVSFIVPYLTGATVVLRGGPVELEVPRDTDFSVNPLYNADGKLVGTPKDIVNEWLRNSNVVRFAEEHAFTDDGTILEFEVPMKQGVEIELFDGRRLPVHSIRVQAKCRKEEQTMELQRAAYGDAALTFGGGSSFSHPVDVVMAQRPGEQAMVAFRISGAKLHRKESEE